MNQLRLKGPKKQMIIYLSNKPEEKDKPSKSQLEKKQTSESDLSQDITIQSKGRDKSSIQVESSQIEIDSKNITVPI